MAGTHIDIDFFNNIMMLCCICVGDERKHILLVQKNNHTLVHIKEKSLDKVKRN